MSRVLVIKYLVGLYTIVMHMLEIFVFEHVGGLMLLGFGVLIFWNIIDYDQSRINQRVGVFLMLLCLFVMVFLGDRHFDTGFEFKNVIYLVGGVASVVVGLVLATLIDKDRN